MQGDQLFLPFESRENSGKFSWKSWSHIKEQNLENFRITYRGFASGHPDRWRHLVPLKTVETGKFAMQFVTSCPAGRSLPSSIDFKETGHSFMQIIIPKTASQAEVFSVGYYPRNLDDLGLRLFKTVPGVYRNHDSNVSRIQARQVVPIVKQYVFENDRKGNPSLYSIVENMGPISRALRAQGKTCSSISMCQINKAMLEKNEPELDRILIELTEIRELCAKGKISIANRPMSRDRKIAVMMQRFEQAQGKHLYHALGANCTSVAYREEAFAVAFLDAKRDFQKAVRVFESQVDLRDHQVGILDRIGDVIARIFLHLFAALPLTGPLLGIGSTHPDAKHLAGRSKTLVPSVLSETAFATHQMLIAPFAARPAFPAGAILSRDHPPIDPPGIFSRIRYLWNRSHLLKPHF